MIRWHNFEFVSILNRKSGFRSKEILDGSLRMGWN